MLRIITGDERLICSENQEKEQQVSQWNFKTREGVSDQEHGHGFLQHSHDCALRISPLESDCQGRVLL